MNATTTRTPAIDATITGDDILTASLVLSFSNDKRISVNPAMLSDSIQHAALMHGLKQKLVDAAAISRNPDTGKTASIDDKYNAVKEVYDRLLAGQWNKTREGGSTKGGLLFRALCILYADKTPEAIRAFLEKKTAAEKTALRNTKKIADIIATLKDDDTDTDGVDTDALLGELN